MSQWISNCQLTHAKSWNDRLLQKATNNAEFRTYCAFYHSKSLYSSGHLLYPSGNSTKLVRRELCFQGLCPKPKARANAPTRPTIVRRHRISEKYCMPGLLPLAELAQVELEWTRSIALIVSCLEHENMLSWKSSHHHRWSFSDSSSPGPRNGSSSESNTNQEIRDFRHLTTLQLRQNRGEQCLILNRLLKTHEVDVTGPHRRYWTAIDCYMQH